MRRRELIAGAVARATVGGGPGETFGVNIGSELRLAPWRNRLLAAYREAGLGWLRVWYNWSNLEPTPGQYRLTGVREELALAKRYGFAVLFVLWGTPRHAGGLVGGGAQPEPRAFERYCWTLRRALAGLVDAWEVGNEPNLTKYFLGSAREYVRTLAVAYPVLRDSGPVVAAGPSGAAGPEHWDQLIAAGLEDWCDRVNLHPYRRHPEQVLRLVDRFQLRVRKPLWITELGLDTSGGEQAKADFLARTFPALAERAERVFWYRGLQGTGFHRLHFGLVEANRERNTLLRLPAYEVLAGIAGAQE